jgi:hypothetical protein
VTDLLNADATAEYYSKVSERLQSSGFEMDAAVRFRDQLFSYVASKTAFLSEKGGLAGTFFVFAEFGDLDLAALRKYSKACFRYSCRRCRIPLLPGFGRAVECYSVALTGEVDRAVGESVRCTEPPRHWAAAEIPVICDLTTGDLYYLERTPYWGRLYWDGRRETVVKMLSPGAQQP